MGLLRSAGVLAAAAVWRLTGSEAPGRMLIEAVVEGDDETGTLAGMLLVKGGDRGRRLVSEALEEGVESPELVTALQSIGGPEAEAELRRLAESDDRAVSPSARRALVELEEIRRRGA